MSKIVERLREAAREANGRPMAELQALMSEAADILETVPRGVAGRGGSQGSRGVRAPDIVIGLERASDNLAQTPEGELRRLLATAAVIIQELHEICFLQDEALAQTLRPGGSTLH